MQSIRVAEGCARCPELAANRNCIVHGYGANGARVVFVGEAPGYRGGDVTGVPFTRDRSGVRLQRMLIELGLSGETEPRLEQPRLRCFITNVVRCNPPANRTPTRAEAGNCLPYLWQELEMLQPLCRSVYGPHHASGRIQDPDDHVHRELVHGSPNQVVVPGRDGVGHGIAGRERTG